MQNMMHHDAMGGADAWPQAVKNDDDDDDSDIYIMVKCL